MIAKVKCPLCNEIHDLEPIIDLNNIPSESSTNMDWSRLVFKCICFPGTHELQDGDRTVKDAKTALREIERDFLNKIIDFEETYGVTIQHIETNLTDIPSYKRNNEMRTNSVLVYGDL